ncbi:MAG: phenylalanine--tRNA ligase subunit alpha [Deltaproteobacteria bacterium]|nr:phenylalanine--tRNA ligase subunit alpha [Deltaproteobacteria bacterium]
MNPLLEQLAALESAARLAIDGARDADALQALRVRFLGRKGELTELLRRMGSLSPDERPPVGQRANAIKQFLESTFGAAEREAKARQMGQDRGTRVDITLPGRADRPGHAHPALAVMEEMKAIFTGLGFSIHEGPEVETDYYNFSALNFLSDHPARDMQDTFYVEGGGAAAPLLLRTHTSPVQIRVMEAQPPPVRIIAPGAVYRRDADLTHSPMFHQVEGLYVDRGVCLGDLKGVLTCFVHALFGADVPVRFRPSFFPFTEPSMEVDIGCVICRATRGRAKASACRVCKGTGWLEILGSGMVHPAVFEAVGYDPDAVSGFAFGLGVERVAMLKYGIDDIRLFYGGDLRFLEQF